MARSRRRNPSKKVVAIGLGTVAIGGAAIWYFFLRKKPAPLMMAVPTAAQAAAGPANPMQAAAMNSLTSLATQLQAAAAGK